MDDESGGQRVEKGRVIMERRREYEQEREGDDVW